MCEDLAREAVNSAKDFQHFAAMTPICMLLVIREPTMYRFIQEMKGVKGGE